VAGINLLRDVEGTEVWAPANVAAVLERPSRHDLPCLWFEPVHADRELPLGETFRWHEYELTVHALPGHTLHAAAVVVEVDGQRILARGDQESSEGDRDVANYYYRNRFRIDDYVESAELYRRLRPDVIVSGHSFPRTVTDPYLDELLRNAQRLASLHRELLPLDDVDLGAEGFAARIEPYRSSVASGDDVVLEVALRNPLGREERAIVRLAVPAGWRQPEPAEVTLAAHGEARVVLRAVAGSAERRARVAADVTVGELRLGQQAEALVDVT
jgi:glyoxylase-like metal-dependent hydrolase (beta-lactamase superfamily II)